MEESKIPVISIIGPTASGKSSLAIEIAKILDGEIVSCDSMQVYKSMDIATAKPSTYELKSVPHHMIGIINPEEKYSVADYCKDAKAVIFDIHNRNKIPILVGGTGLYYESLIKGITFSESHCDEDYRNELKRIAENKGLEYLWNQLYSIDSESALKIHINDSKRIIRALEIYHDTGETKSTSDIKSTQSASDFVSCSICLDVKNRDFLYDRINNRVDKMINDGLLDESQSYFNSNYSSTSVQAIGYKELKPYFDGNDDLENCIEKLKKSTRNYAKRQLSWFHRYDDINYIYIDEYNDYNVMIKDTLKCIERSGYFER